MPFATLFSDLAARLFSATPSDASIVEPELVTMGVEAVIDAVDPRLRAVSGYSRKMAPAIARTITHLRELVQLMPPPVALSRAAWANDSFLNTVFATAEDISAVLGRSDELRSFFAARENYAATAAYVLLGMLKTERNVLAPAMVDGALHRDVAQTTISFSHHRLLCPAADALACRREVGVLILRRLAALVLERISAIDERANELEQHKVVLGVRLRLLHLRRGGLQQIAQDAIDVDAEIALIERELKATVDDYLETKASLSTMQARIHHIEAIFGRPAEYLKLDRITQRVNRLGYKIAAGSGELASELTLNELSIGDGLKIVIAFVSCQRTDLPPAESLATRGAQALV